MLIYRLTRLLDQSKVDYAIVGGFAVALHGIVRGTIDVDIVIELSERDFIEAEKVFKLLGLESRLPVNGQQVFQFRQEYIKNKNLIAWSFYNPRNPIETVDVIITHNRKKMKIEKIESNGFILKVASISELIKMKTESARAQDLVDIEALKRIKNEKS